MKLNHTYAEAADALGISESYLQEHIKRLPHRGYGRRVLFSDADLAVINEMHAVLPGQQAPQVKPTTLPAPVPQPLRDLKPRKASKQSA